MLRQADVVILTYLVVIQVTVTIKVQQKDACVLKAVEAALHSVWIQNQHIAAL